MKEVFETRWERIEDETGRLAQEQDKVNNIFSQIRYEIESAMDALQKGNLTITEARFDMLETLDLLYYGWDEDEE